MEKGGITYGNSAQIRDRLLERVPAYMKLDFDNVGLLVGRQDKEVRRALVSLDITVSVIAEAAELGAELIVSHHPVIFHPVRTITDGDPTGQILLELAERGVAAICAHTNLDAAQGGVNDCLAKALELTQIEQLHQDGVDREGRPYGIGRVGLAHCPGVTAGEFAAGV